jgi:hypothetical protein
MQSFEWVDAESVEQAVSLLAEGVSRRGRASGPMTTWCTRTLVERLASVSAPPPETPTMAAHENSRPHPPLPLPPLHPR